MSFKYYRRLTAKTFDVTVTIYFLKTLIITKFQEKYFVEVKKNYSISELHVSGVNFVIGIFKFYLLIHAHILSHFECLGVQYKIVSKICDSGFLPKKPLNLIETSHPQIEPHSKKWNQYIYLHRQ